MGRSLLASRVAELAAAHFCDVCAMHTTDENGRVSPAASDERVGGDWYDAFALDDHRVLISIGDVTGHGLQASIIMAKIRHSLNAVAMYENDLSRMLDVAEAITLRRFPLAIATAFVAVVDTNAGTITYANAGHPRPLLRARDGSIKELSAYGLPIGVRHLGTKSPPPCSTASKWRFFSQTV